KEELKYQFSNCEQTIALEHTITSKNINIYYTELEYYLDPMQTPIAKDIKDLE
ncbi:28463_t:CDS:2, partial [Gigaspora margarita]